MPLVMNVFEPLSDELVTVPDGGVAIDARSEPVPGLGHGDGEDQLAPGHPGEPPLALLLGGVVQK